MGAQSDLAHGFEVALAHVLDVHLALVDAGAQAFALDPQQDRHQLVLLLLLLETDVARVLEPHGLVVLLEPLVHLAQPVQLLAEDVDPLGVVLVLLDALAELGSLAVGLLDGLEQAVELLHQLRAPG